MGQTQGKRVPRVGPIRIRGGYYRALDGVGGILDHLDSEAHGSPRAHHCSARDTAPLRRALHTIRCHSAEAMPKCYHQMLRVEGLRVAMPSLIRTRYRGDAEPVEGLGQLPVVLRGHREWGVRSRRTARRAHTTAKHLTQPPSTEPCGQVK